MALVGPARALAAVLALALAAAVPALAPAPAAAQAAQETEAGIVVRGNRRIEAATIVSYLALPTDRVVTAEDLNAALRRLFETGLFRDARITPAGGQLIVEVVENPSINEIAFEGNDAVTDEDLQRIVSARPRFPFSAAAAEQDAQAIIEVYRRTGRYGASVEPVVIERSENRVDLVFEIDEGEPTGVNSIDFVGNRAFSDSRLREEIETSESGILSVFFSTDVYDPDRLELDRALLRQFYLSRGYADFEVLSTTAELAVDGSGFFIAFTVSEGEQYSFGTLDVAVAPEGLERDDFLALVPTDLEGEIYDATEIEEIANTLTDLAAQRGFAFAQVRPRADKDTEGRVIDVVFEVSEGNRIFVERIDIEGNTRTLDRVIRREIELVEGDAFDSRKIRRARSAIRGLNYFDRVEIETEEGSADDRAVLKVRVREKSTGSISFGLGFSTSSGPIGSVDVTERNFLGRGQIVNARVTAAGDTQVYDFSFTEPMFLDRDLSVTGRAFFIQDDREDESSFDITRLGIQPQIGFPLSEEARLRLRYDFERDDLTAADDASLAIVEDEGVRFKSSVGYRLTYDARNDTVEPTGGFLASLDQEFAGLGGDARFVKTTATLKGWQGFFDDDYVLSLEVEGGALFSFGDDTRVNDRFFLGGSNFRGFADEGLGPRDLTTNDSLGGNYYGVTRAELSFPLGLPEELGIYGGVFVDAGFLFGLDRTQFGTVSIDDGLSVRVAAGALLFINSPFGPIELSLGFPVVKEDFDETEIFRLSVGTRF